MKKSAFIFGAIFSLICGGAFAQSSPNLIYGQVPTAAQWNSYFQAKQDVLSFPNSTLNLINGTLGINLANPNTWSATQTFSAAPIFSSLTGYVYANGAGAVTAGTTIPVASVTNATPQVATKAALQSVASTTYPYVMRMGYAVAGDAPPLTYVSSSSACSLNAGAGDGGSQVPSSDGKCWLAVFGQCLDVSEWGANGSPGDGQRIQYALNTASSSGGSGCVFARAIGAPYIIDTGLSIPNGVAIYGAGGTQYNGLTATVAQWSSKGTWLECTDPTNPCVSMLSHGSTIDGINFIWNQVIPTTGSYTPTAFPDGIYITGTFFRLRNIVMVGGTRCVNINYNSTSGGGTYSEINDLKLGCLSAGIKETDINDNVYIGDLDVRPLWYMTNSSLVNYVEANLVGLDINYWDNPSIKTYQCFQCYAAFKFTNSTALGNTHSLYNGQLVDIQCNLVRICMLANGTPTISFQAGNLQAQQDTASGLTDTLFQLGTDNLEAAISNLAVITAGAQVMTVGNGNSGRVKIGNLTLGTSVNGSNVYGYSAVASGQTAIVVNAGASLAIGQRSVVRAASAGQFISGSGADNIEMPMYCWQPASIYGQFTLPTGSGSAANFTTNNQLRTTNYGKFLQMRLTGGLNVTTAQSGGTAIIQMGSFNSVSSGSLNAASTGVKSFDSNWVDVQDTGVVLGYIQENMTSGVVATFGDLTFCAR